MKSKFSFILLLCLSLLAGPLFGQGAREAGSVAKEQRTVVDHNGDVVSLPDDIQRIVISSLLPLPSVYCLFEGDASKLVGMHPSSMAAAKNSILPDIMPDIVNVNSSFVSGGEMNIEEVVKLKPDVVFYNASNKTEREKLKAAGIPAVAFSASKWNYNVIETFNAWVELLGEVLQQENKASGITEYANEVYAFIHDRLASAPDLKKPKAMVLYTNKNGIINISGETSFGQFWLDSTGGENIAAHVPGFSPTVNMEQIYEWNPDIIYITNFVPLLPEDFYNNVIEGQDWSHVKAVKEGKVYISPLGMYRWTPPSSDVPVALLWMATCNQPELFADIDIREEVRSYYKRFYHMDLSESQLDRIFSPSREAAY